MGALSRRASAEEWVAAWNDAGCSPAALSKAKGWRLSGIYKRRANLEAEGYHLPSVPLPGAYNTPTAEKIERAYAKREALTIEGGAIVVFSDAHWWPGLGLTLAHTAMLKLIKRIKPAVVVANGDIFDGAAISRHDPDGWQNVPTVMAELETVKAYMDGIADASRGAVLMRTIGNHDLRFDRRLATRVPDFKHLAGMRLRDHLPAWSESWSVEINGDTIIKHRWHNGVHGPHNNVLKGGRTIVTGHLHRLQASAWTDYNGRRWGVDTGTLSDPDAQAFDYAEDAPKNWGSGFAVLTFRGGMLLPPEFCEVINGAAYFRGQVVHEQVTERVGAGSGLRAGGIEGGKGGDVPSGLGKRRNDKRSDASAKRGVAAGAADASK